MSLPTEGESETVFPLHGERKRVWLSGHHREVLKTLDAAIEQGRGVLLLTGEPGSGKTTLARVLADGLIGTDVRVGRLPASDVDPLELYRVLGEMFPGQIVGGPDFLSEFRGFLREMVGQGQRVLLILDDAHRLRAPLCAELVNLLQLDQEVSEERGVFTVLLAGRRTLETTLQRPEHAALARLIRVRCTLRPLTSSQVAGYVGYHLGAAGFDANWFTPEAVDEICKRSGGIPRMINVVSGRALQAGLAAGAPTIDAALVRQCGVDEIPEQVYEPEALVEVTPAADDQREDFTEMDGQWRMVRVGGVAALGVTIVLGLLFYVEWRSSAHSITTGTSKSVELPARDLETSEPSVTAAAERPVTAEKVPLPPAVPVKRSPAPEEVKPMPAAAPRPSPPTVIPAPSRPRTDDQDPSAIIDWLLKQTPDRQD